MNKSGLLGMCSRGMTDPGIPVLATILLLCFLLVLSLQSKNTFALIFSEVRRSIDKHAPDLTQLCMHKLQ